MMKRVIRVVVLAWIALVFTVGMVGMVRAADLFTIGMLVQEEPRATGLHNYCFYRLEDGRGLATTAVDTSSSCRRYVRLTETNYTRMEERCDYSMDSGRPMLVYPSPRYSFAACYNRVRILQTNNRELAI